MKTMRCVDCYQEFSEDEVGNRSTCPGCGTSCVPMAISQDVTIPINWHELRIMTIWASNYAENLEEPHRVSLHRILGRLNKYRPPGAPALILVGEIKELQDQFPSASLYVGDELIVPPRDDEYLFSPEDEGSDPS